MSACPAGGYVPVTSLLSFRPFQKRLAETFTGISFHGDVSHYSTDSFWFFLPIQSLKARLRFRFSVAARLVIGKQRIDCSLQHFKDKAVSVPRIVARKVAGDVFDLVE